MVLDTVHARRLPAVPRLPSRQPSSADPVIVTTHDAARRVPVDPADRRVTIIDREQLQATPDEAALIACASAPGLDVNSVEEIAAAAGGWVAAHPRGRPLRTSSIPERTRRLLAHVAGGRRAAGPVARPTAGRPAAVPARHPRPRLARRAAVRQHPRDLRQPRRRWRTSRRRAATSRSSLPPAAAADPPLRWWRRHPLRHRGADTGGRRWWTSPSATSARPAGSWRTGGFEPAMRHLMAAGRVEEAGRYLSAHENALFEEGRGQTAPPPGTRACRPTPGAARLAPRADGLGPGHLPGPARGQARHSRSCAPTWPVSPAEGAEQRVLAGERRRPSRPTSPRCPATRRP